MNKSVILVISIIGGVILIGIILLFGNSNRYDMRLDKNDILYKLDRKTGRVWEIYGNEQLEIRETSANKSSELSEETVIEKSKSSFCMDEATLKGYRRLHESNDFRIKAFMEKTNGPLTITGWRANRYDEQRYLVSYTFDDGFGELGWFFEVNTKAEIIRYVNGDLALEEFYDLEYPNGKTARYLHYKIIVDSALNKSIIPLRKKQQEKN